MDANRYTRFFSMTSGQTFAMPCAVLTVMAMIAVSSAQSLADPPKIEIKAPDKIFIESAEAPVSEIVEALRQRLGFRFVDKTGGNCGTYSGKISGSLSYVLARITRDCGFIILREQASHAASRVSLVYLVESNVGSDRPNDGLPIKAGGVVNRSTVVGGGSQQPENRPIPGETAWERQVRDLVRKSPRN